MENPINYWYQKYLSLKVEMDKMKAKAVEADVNTYENIPGGSYVEFVADIPEFKACDKVRIIVLPNED